jgi:hypothetical protein
MGSAERSVKFTPWFGEDRDAPLVVGDAPSCRGDSGSLTERANCLLGDLVVTSSCGIARLQIHLTVGLGGFARTERSRNCGRGMALATNAFPV